MIGFLIRYVEHSRCNGLFLGMSYAPPRLQHAPKSTDSNHSNNNNRNGCRFVNCDSVVVVVVVVFNNKTVWRHSLHWARVFISRLITVESCTSISINICIIINCCIILE